MRKNTNTSNCTKQKCGARRMQKLCAFQQVSGISHSNTNISVGWFCRETVLTCDGSGSFADEGWMRDSYDSYKSNVQISSPRKKNQML